MRVHRAVALSLGLGVALTLNGGRYVAEQILPAARAQETPAETLTAQLRRQGHRCEGPVNVERDAERSKPDEPVWVVKCTNASYRMRLIPHTAAHVEQI